MPKLVKLETDANVSNYTPQEGNITTFFTAEDGAVKLKYKNSAGEIAELSGGGGGVLVRDSMALVTSYQSAYTKITSLQLSGMIDDSDNSGYDLTPANGTYTVTAETADKSPQERIYKHTSQNYYVYYIPESTDGMYYGKGWAINNSIVYDTMSVLMYTSNELVEGTSNWSGEMNMLYMPVTISNIQSSLVPAVLTAVEVTGYNPTTLQYSIDYDAAIPITTYDYEPEVHGIYAVSGTRLIGKPIGNEGGGHLRTYIPWRAGKAIDKITNYRNSYSEYYAPAWQYPTLRCYSEQVNYVSVTTMDGKSCVGSLDYNTEMNSNADWNLCYAEYDGKFYSYPKNANRYWSMGCLVHGGNQTSKKQRAIFCCQDNIAKMSIDAEWSASTPRIVVYRDDTEVITYTNSGLSSGWHHVLLTYDYDNLLFVLYVDGTKRGEYSFKFEGSNSYNNIFFGTGRADDAYRICYLCELKFWDITLTPAMVTAEYQRVMDSM